MKTRGIALLAGSLLVLGVASRAWPWGDVGHTVVCEIAFQELNKKARREVVRLIRTDPEYRTFAEACTWPDHWEYRNQRAAEHFINVPRDFQTFTGKTCPVASECLFTAIDKELAVLTKSKNDKAKLAALKFLGHWIGDLHEPLHVSFADDRGGNKIGESGGVCNGSLHGVWDTCIIEKKLGTNWRSVARDVGESITNADRAEWLGTSTMVDWAGESLKIARAQETQYCVLADQTCRYDEMRVTYEPQGGERIVVVDGTYLDYGAPVVAERLRKAGVRLADLLNRSLGR